MPEDQRERLRGIRTFPSLVKYLHDELDWPITPDDFEDHTFEYTAEELGIDSKNAAKIQEIKRLRPLTANQPWGIFFVKFEPKRLPVVALRRILNQVVLKKRASANSIERAAWELDDLLFASNYGDGDERRISFAHFKQEKEKHLPSLKVLGWDNLDTSLHLDHIAYELREKLHWPGDEDNADKWREDWRSAFTITYREVITTSRALAIKLAELARAIRDRTRSVLEVETEEGPVTKLMDAFKESLIHDLDEDDFADMYAQTITYGLLSARIANPDGDNTTESFSNHLSVTNPFLRELMETFLHTGTGKVQKSDTRIDFDELGISEVVDLLDNANIEAVVRDFGDRNPQEDPVIHFYELFLKEYDAKKRMQRGVFYTPRPVVSFIVRSVDELLRTEFGLEDGLADTTTWGEMTEKFDNLEIPEGATPEQAFVQILDPATGTGTFLVEVIDVIFNTMKEKWENEYGPLLADVDKRWNEYVPKHLLPRLYGYELLMAPYAIAHMKIGLKLFETKYRFQHDERIRVYLTNSLEPAQEFSGKLEFAIPALAHEAEAVNTIKRNQRFTVVIGNPPYSIISSNSGSWIVNLCEIYKENVRQRERQIQALSDDYVKFIRLVHWIIGLSQRGVVGMITNNGFLDGHLFKDLRRCLLETFYCIKVLNLHGNLRTQEKTPDGFPDSNVFDIQTGVSINCMVKGAVTEVGQFSYADLWGDRLRKYQQLSGGVGSAINWNSLNIKDENLWLLVDESRRSEWECFIPLTDVFGTGDSTVDAQKRYAAGFVSQQDEFAIAFTSEEIAERIEKLLAEGMTEEKMRESFRLCTTSQWNYNRARDELKIEDIKNLITSCTYRPFDRRWTAFHRGVVTILRKELMRHLFKQKNYALLATRGISRQSFAHIFIANEIVDRHAIDNASESMFVFPLFIFPDASIEGARRGLFEHVECVSNISPSFFEYISALFETRVPDSEGILALIYSLLHSSNYRSRYSEFLASDFPRIPMPLTQSLLQAAIRHGTDLISLHLMESPKLDDHITTLVGSGEYLVEKVSYSDKTVWIDKAKTKGFLGVPEEVWTFHIGGYQVCHKWLKDRQAKGGKNPRPGRILSDGDIEHYQKIVVALNETIRIMKEIDKAIEEHGGWPDAFKTDL